MLAVCVLLAFTAACKSKKEEPAGGEEVIGEVTLRVLNHIDLDSPNAQAELDAVWAEFAERHPNIKIEREDFYGHRYNDTLTEYIVSGNMPDVVYVWPAGDSYAIHTGGFLKDLTALAERDGIAGQFKPEALDPAAQAGGKLAMLPNGMATSGRLVANMEVLDGLELRPATTYTELNRQKAALLEAGYEIIAVADEPPQALPPALISAVASQCMGEDWAQLIFSGVLNFTNERFISTLKTIKLMYDEGMLSISGGGDAGLFTDVKAAYYLVTDETAAPSGENFKSVAFPELDLPGVQFSAYFNSKAPSGGWGINASLDGNELEAAWILVKWLTGKEAASYLLKTGGITAPARTDIDTSENQHLKAIYAPLYNHLPALILGAETPENVAQLAQDALRENW
jgi:raffinose/stachyose/melibiose transport system substrate-binding protein